MTMNRVNLDFSVSRSAYEKLLDLARRGGYSDLENLFRHGILVMELITSSYEEGYEFVRLKDDGTQEEITFVLGDQNEEVEEEIPLYEEPAEVIPLFPPGDKI